MRHLGHERFVLFGHSYGGMLALEYALRHPDRLDGLILCGTAPAWDYDEEIARNAAARGTPRELAALEAMRRIPIGSDERFRQLWVAIQPLYFHRVDADAIEKMDAGMRYSASAYELSEVLLTDFDISDRIHAITVPTLILVGADDWVTPPSQSLRIQEALLHAELAIFTASGHYLCVEEHERFIAMVGDWIAARR
jgi:proline iminopeptidase